MNNSSVSKCFKILFYPYNTDTDTFWETSYWYFVAGGQEQQSMKEILATLARTSEGSDQLPSYEGLSISLLNNFDHHIYLSDLPVLFKVRNVYLSNLLELSWLNI